MVFKTELIRRVWEKVNIGKTKYKERLRHEDVEIIINAFLKELIQCMIDAEDVNIVGFGKFVSNTRKSRIAFDQIHKEKILLPDRRVIKFNISKEIDQHVRGDGGFKRLEESEK